MPDARQGRIAIDDIVEATSLGVLRALESRKIAGRDFTQKNGFFVKFDLTVGGFPFPIDRFGGGGFTQTGLPQGGG